MTATPLTLIKVGGKIVEEPDSLSALLADFTAIGGAKVLCHGGGRSATAMAARLGIETTMIGGRRVTDDAMLDVVTMVYGGLVNKTIVAALQGRGVNAIGITGADLDLVRSHRRPVTKESIDYGWVGDVDRVNASALASLISQDIVPVVAPLSHDGQGHMLNTNADTIAQSVASALAAAFAVRLVYCFEHPGVMADPDDPTSVIAHIDPAIFETLKSNGTVSGGMLPKLENAFEALHSGVSEVIITSASSLSDLSAGTHITL